MIIEKELSEDIKSLRKILHKYPDLSSKEAGTVKIIKNFAKKYFPDSIIENLGGKSLIVVIDSKKAGKNILIRCELDALPIQEINEFEYKSSKKNISHKCGHDGHMAIVCGLMPILKNKPPKSGKVFLLFQAAEETGTGAEKLIKDPRFQELKTDYAFALHNLPGYPTGKLIYKHEEVSAASSGMIIKLKGKTSHASAPEDGISPAPAISKLIENLNLLADEFNQRGDFALITIIHIKMGEAAFGTSPGDADFMLTLRAYKNNVFEELREKTVLMVKEEAEKNNLGYEISWTDYFPATYNSSEAAEIIEKAAQENNTELIRTKEAFRWSEDFGHICKETKGVLFCLGSGESHPQLHNPDYDFPEGIIPDAIRIFYSIIDLLCNRCD